VRFSVSKHASAILLNEKAEMACQRAIRYHRDPRIDVEALQNLIDLPVKRNYFLFSVQISRCLTFPVILRVHSLRNSQAYGSPHNYTSIDPGLQDQQLGLPKFRDSENATARTAHRVRSSLKA
jgi:hypothetical protein